MTWAVLGHSKGAVDRAGTALVNAAPGSPEMMAALEVIENWRACHAFPLNTIQVGLRRLARAADKSALIAQRIKRLPAIETKLRLIPNLDLSKMQDIGGCRAIVRDVAAVYEVAAAYDRSRMEHSLRRPFDDYIVEPRAETGYRGIHIICTYKSGHKSEYNGQKIEVQLRSRAQHMWATAVEAVGTYTRLALKSNQGDAAWIRFFALMSSYIAYQEDAPAVANTPPMAKGFREELRAVVHQLKAVQMLRMINEAGVRVSAIGPKKARHFLVRLDADTGRTIVESFSSRDREKAQARYTDVEQSIAQENRSSDAVLVAVSDERALRRAYPNYFLNVRRFLFATIHAGAHPSVRVPWMRSRRVNIGQYDLPLR